MYHDLPEAARPSVTRNPRRGEVVAADSTKHDGQRIPALDGVRGLAVLLVMMRHFLSSDKTWLLRNVAGAGWVGVDLFFVLSGFLITRILRSSLGSERYFLNFYARRALRIWPLYYSVLFFAFFVTPAFPAPLRIGLEGLPYYATFTQNLFMPNHFGPWAIAGTWSLAIEEQFYLLWPLCVRHLRRRSLVGLLVCIILSAPIARFVALSEGVPPCTVYLSSVLRVDALAAGALAALLFDSDARAALQRFSGWVGPVALGAGLGLCVTWVEHSLVTSQVAVGIAQALALTVAYSMLAVGFAALVTLAASESLAPLNAVLRRRGLQFFGRISFGLYLLQGIVIPMTQAIVRPWLAANLNITGMPVTGIVIIVGGSASLALALSSWRFLELPALRLRRHFPVR